MANGRSGINEIPYKASFLGTAVLTIFLMLLLASLADSRSLEIRSPRLARAALVVVFTSIPAMFWVESRIIKRRAAGKSGSKARLR